MAHNLRMVEGEAGMAFTGETPWHGLGTKLDAPMTAEEAIVAAKLDYTVTKEKLFLADGREAPSFCTMASDTMAMLGVVGDRYQPLQNKDAFGFFDVLVGAGEARYETAGALGQGERIWLLAKMPETVEAVKNDPIETFVLLSNSHDGSTSVEARYTTIRVVCQNTLHMATSASKAVVSIRHTKSVEARLKLAAGLLSGYQEHLGQFSDAMKLLAKVRINDDMIAAFENHMFGDVDKVPEGRGRTMLSNNLSAFENLLVKGRGTEIPGVVGTAYGMVNAYTEWADFTSQVKGTTDRTNAIIFGNAASKKTEAMEFALVLAKGVK
jgi:phage/plasmid-like protein (TIGR03299 family)